MRRVRIVSGGTVAGSRVYDAESGDEIGYVSRIELVVDADRGRVTAAVFLDMPPVDVTVEADIVPSSRYPA